MKKIYTYLQLGLGLLIALLIPELGLAQTCDVTPMNISKIATDWTTNCARVSDNQCDPTNGPLCSSAANSNWLLLNQNDYCIPKPPCNAVGFSKIEVTMTMEGTWTVKNIGNQSQNTSVGLLGCIKAWVDDVLFDPLEPSAFTGTITLAPNEEKSGALPTRTKTSQFPGDLDALFAKSCAGTLCVEGLADGFTTLTISNGNLQAITTVLASLKACVNYKKFTWSVTGSEAACETSSDGKVFVSFTPASGTSASDYEIRVGNGGTWTVAQTAVSGANTISGLPAGSYTVAVVYKPLANTVIPSDSESCGYCKSSVTVGSATANISCASTPDCPGGAGDGTVGVSVTGNNLGTVKYLWGNGATTSSITGLTSGSYSVTVTYGPGNKCSKIQTCTVDEAPGVDADVSFTNVKCKDAADGTITVDPTSGTANFTIAVTGKSNQTTSGASRTFTGFGPGTYTVTVTDKNGCVYTEMVEITEPPAIMGSITPTPAACTGATNGSATVSASGGTGAYTYNWSRGTVGMGGTQVTGLAPGSISVTITDANNCTKVLTGNIGTVSEVSIMCTPTPEKCVDQDNGSVSVAVSNASPNYVASWVSGPTQFSQVSSATSPVMVNNLKPGNYRIRITDNNGCYAECTFTIEEGLDLPCSISGGSSICQGVTENTHSVTSVNGATYAWSLEGNTAGASIPGITTNSTVTVSIPSNATGSYTIRMTISKDGCTETCTKTVSITQPIACTINGPASVCEGSTATFTTSNVTNRVWTVSGGLSFSGQGTNSITVTIPDGTVLSNFTVGLSGTGSNGCPTNCSTTTTINQKPTSSVQALQPVCNLGTPQGVIRATASGTAPFVYRLYKHIPTRTLINTSISTVSTTYDFINLGPGTYDVEVTDANNCTSDPSATIILVTPVSFEPELDCESRNAGNIDIVLNIANGTGPFTYSLDNNSFSAVPGNGIITIPFVDGVNQTIYLKDANDCPAISETILLQCCKLAGECKLTKPAPLTGCDYSVVPPAKTNPNDVFSNITFCEEAKIKVTTSDGGSLCGDGLTRTYTYVLYDDLNDNDKFDEDDEPYIEGTCAETYVVKAPTLSCNAPNDYSIQETCTTQDISSLFSTWKNAFTYTGGCSPMIRYLVSINDGTEVEYQSIANITAPTFCGGKVKIKILVKDACTAEKMCMSTFFVPTRPTLVAEGPKDVTKEACASTSDFASWKAAFQYTSGGCNYKIKYEVSINGNSLNVVANLSSVVAPSSCGGSVRIKMTVTDDCDQTVVKDATYTVPTRPTLVAEGPKDVTKEACASTSDFANWKAAFQYTSGGCNYKIKYEVSINGGSLNVVANLSSVVAPSSCGGSVRIKMTVTDDCDQTVVKDATYTVPTRPTLVAAGPENVTKEACASTSDFASWKAAFQYTSGGCNYKIKYEVSINGNSLNVVANLSSVVAPSSCGGSVRIKMTVTDDCDQTVVKDATYTVPTRPTLVAAGPENVTKEACASTSDFANWKAAFQYTSGGCNYKIKYEVSINGNSLNVVANLSSVVAPSSCGGSVRIKMTVTDDCDQTVVKDATYTVPTRPTLVAAGPENVTKEACASTSDFASWKAAFQYTSGGCNYKIKYEVSINGGSLNVVANLSSVLAPSSCGGSVRIKMTVTDDCDQTVVKDATYTVLTRPDLVITIPADKTLRCLLQADINTQFTAWLAQFSTSGGCSAVVKYFVNDEEVANLNNVAAPSECGGTVSIRVSMTDNCDQSLSKTASFEVIPKPVGSPLEKTIYSCIAANVNLQLQVKCDVQSTFKWYSVASIGSSTPYNHPNVDGETYSPVGTSSTINDLLTNLSGSTQTIIYRVVPTSLKDCEGDPFYVTITIRPKAGIQCLACLTEVRVSLDEKCRKLITPDLVVDGFEQCPNRELLRDALEVLIDDGNNDSYVDCAGTHKYVIRLKPEYAACFDYQPCWGTIIAEDKTGPIIECVDFIKEPLDCYDVNYVLNNHRTIGKVGETNSPRTSAVGNQIIPNAEGVGEAGTCNLLPPNLVSDNIKNLGYVYFRDNCRDCGCRTTVKWNDRVEYFTCEQMKTNGGIYARIYREWIATDCNGMITSKVQEINFKRPALKDFVFNAVDTDITDKYDRVVEYNACTPDKSLIKKADVTPFDCSWFDSELNPRCLYIDQVECNYSVTIKDTEFPICGGKGVKIDRELYIFDWCAGGIVDTLHILIKIGDFEAPTAEYAHGAPYDISTGPMDCTAAIPVTLTGIKAQFGVSIKDNCTLGNVSVSVYTKDRYVKGILVHEGPDYPFCIIKEEEPEARTQADLRGNIEDDQLIYCKKENICWEKVDYTVMNGMMVGLPVGRHLMVIDASDGCYNASTICFIFDVKDKIAPVMKCDDDLHVSLSNANGYTNGYAQVSAADIDEGSWDNCKLAWIAVRRNVPASCEASFVQKGYDSNGNGRLDAAPFDHPKDAPANFDWSTVDGVDNNGDGDIRDFGEFVATKGGKKMTPLLDFVEFFCCDLSERVTVELWGADTADDPKTLADETNYNYCWMDLLIEDKVAPTCVAPWDVTIDCDDKNIALIDDKVASSKLWGDVTITTGNDCAALDTVYSVEKSLKCGYGKIVRKWTLSKQTAKGPITITCSQTIWVRPIHQYNIRFPKDATTDCKTPSPDTVIVDELACDLLAVNVSDKRYDATGDECYKIFRTYTVINWCAYDDKCGDPMAEGNVFVVDRGLFQNNGAAPIYVLVRDDDRDLNEEFYLSTNLTPNEPLASNGRSGDYHVFGDNDRNGGDSGNGYRSTDYATYAAGLPVSNPAKVNTLPRCDAYDLSTDHFQDWEYYHSFMYTQIIKVYDDTRPVVTGIRDTFCTSPTACTANIVKVVNLKDNCSDKVTLENQYLMIAPFQTTDAGKMILYSAPRWSIRDLGNGNYEISVTNLPEGTHDLIVVGRDECGNLSLATRIPFVVKDCKAPAPICINGLSVDLMPDGNGGGMMTVWATDFVASPIYDCNGQGPETKDGLKKITKYSVNRVKEPVNPNQTSISVNCADLELGFILVELHAWDEAGNHDFCVTFVEVQDNRKVCPKPGTIVTGEISGLISTDEAEPVSGVKIDVSGAAQMDQNSASNGVFNFSKLPLGSDFTVAAQLDKDHLNGVSTFDLVQLQKHILGVQPINNPYRLIAADVNNSKSITTLDLIQIRKLILNIDQRFNSVPSWRFVDAAYKFPNPSNPWMEAFPEVVNINDLAGKVQANFIAIKMGDVNGNANVSSISTAEVRGSKALKLTTEDQQLKAGQSYAVAIRAKDLNAVQGFQFTLQFDPTQVQLENIEYNGMMKAEHFGLFPQSGQITSSFVRAPLVGARPTNANQDLLFTLHLKAEADGLLSEVLAINSRLTPQEAYSGQDELMNVELEVNGQTFSDQAILHQNTPNPFVDETAIGFYLPQNAEVSLSVRDVKGALLYSQKGHFAKGENQILLKNTQLGNSGVLYYTLETADFTASKKMILLNK